MESGLLILTFYQSWLLLPVKLFKIVDFISGFPLKTLILARSTPFYARRKHDIEGRVSKITLLGIGA